MSKIVERLPFLSSARQSSEKKHGLYTILEYAVTRRATFHPSIPERQAYLGGFRPDVRPDPILTWDSVGMIGANACPKRFPAIVDTGSNGFLTISKHQLRTWLPAFPFLDCELKDVKREVVANSSGSPPSGRPRLGLQDLRAKIGSSSGPKLSLRQVWPFWTSEDPDVDGLLPLIAAGLYLFPNEPGERDEQRQASGAPTAEPPFKVQIRGILARPGAAVRPTLLGMGTFSCPVFEASSANIRKFDALTIDFPNSTVDLTYSRADASSPVRCLSSRFCRALQVGHEARQASLPTRRKPRLKS